ncbi:axotactin-like [Physella acuta]|uniref:axotactin-like n=1 Tax=Physella acuta TaxID=109671 RepID=UPI0027DC8BCC|nr:axotactin-like [Physella acuta]
MTTPAGRELTLTARLGALILVVGALLSLTEAVATVEQTWTFNKPGVSSLAFLPILSDTRSLHFTFQFKTNQANGILFQHVILDAENKAIPLLSDYQLFAELRLGRLNVSFAITTYQDDIVIGKALDDDKWHVVNIEVDPKKTKLTVSVDRESQNEILNGYYWMDTRELLVWRELKSVVYIGDFKPRKNIKYQSYIGCLGEIGYTLPSGTITSPTFNSTSGVVGGCVDLCQGDRSCNLGRCINRYTGITCDCYGTDHEGQFCNIEGSKTMTFRGYEWVAYQRFEEKRFTKNTRISLEFKTGRGAGVLLYAVGASPYHNHITISIYNGAIHASISFEKDDLTFSEGIGLDDKGWHNLTIDHRESVVSFYLDGKATEKRIAHGYYLNLDPFIYIGGGDNFVQTKGLPVTQSFVGCLRNVYVDDVSVLYELSQANPKCRYNGGRQPQFGCEEVTEIPISFPRSSSMLQWMTGEREQNLSVEFKLRTFHNTAIVLFVELMSRKESGVGFDFGTIELWIVDKMAVVQFIPSSRDTMSHENITQPTIISDGQVHEIMVTLTNR